METDVDEVTHALFPWRSSSKTLTWWLFPLLLPQSLPDTVLSAQLLQPLSPLSHFIDRFTSLSQQPHEASTWHLFHFTDEEIEA
jgi:hypothetical protein